MERRVTCPPSPETPRSPTSSRWAQLIARIYEAFPLLCPQCGAEMRIIALLTDPFTFRPILEHLDIPTRPPPLSPARAPPQTSLDFDQSPDFDLTDPEPIPEFDFDQSIGA